MKILAVNSFHHLRGGDSAYAFFAADGMQARGHELRHFAMRHPENFASDDAAHFAPSIDFPSLHARRDPRAVATVVGSAIYSRPARRALCGLLEQFRPDVAHLHSVMHHLTASVLLELYARRIPVVWTLHDYKSVCPTTLLLRQGKPCEACSGGKFLAAVRYRCKRDSAGASLLAAAELRLHRHWRLYERAAALIAPSEFLAAKVTQMGLRPRRIVVLPNPAPPAQPSARRQDGGYLLYVGRLSREKGLVTLLEAASRRPQLELRIAGQGELGPQLQALARERSVRAQFLGHVQGEALAALYAKARALVVPSEWYENCPMVVLEAASFGLPVLASRIGGLPELVRDGEHGWLVPAGDVEAWAQALAAAWTDGDECRRRGDALRAHVAQRHDASVHLSRLETIYREASGELACA
jgi:glycosyltransferase involved in cell wall biosynthesis